MATKNNTNNNRKKSIKKQQKVAGARGVGQKTRAGKAAQGSKGGGANLKTTTKRVVTKVKPKAAKFTKTNPGIQRKKYTKVDGTKVKVGKRGVKLTKKVTTTSATSKKGKVKKSRNFKG